MTEMKHFGSFTIDDIGSAFKELANDNLPCAVFTNMADGAHDDLVDIHKIVYKGIGKRALNQKPLRIELLNLGCDLDAFSYQPFPYNIESVPEFEVTTIDLIEPGIGVSWHQDIVNGPGTNPDSPNAISLPFGFGVSINLVNQSDFYVEDFDRTIDLAHPFTKAFIAQTIGASGLGDSIDTSEHDILHATLYPGDVVIWRQPYAHKVIVPESQPPKKQRRSITIMREAIFDAVDIPIAAA
jgi:hypothetical protein